MKTILSGFSFSIILIVSPCFSNAQTTVFCDNFTSSQIIDSLNKHPELKYSIKYPCFDKLSYKMINRIYGTDEFSVNLIKKYKDLHTTHEIGKLIFVSTTVLTIILFGSISPANGDANYQLLATGILLTPIDIIGITALAIGGDYKKKLYNGLIK